MQVSLCRHLCSTFNIKEWFRIRQRARDGRRENNNVDDDDDNDNDDDYDNDDGDGPRWKDNLD